MFDIKTFPGINIKENETEYTKIFYDQHFQSWILEDKESFWMGLNTFNNYQIKHFYSQYDLAHGNVLCTGLGFGLLPVWLANKPEVTSITVIERSKDVINFFKEANKPNSKISIINADATQYRSNEHFDCVFLDHYETQKYTATLEQAANISDNVPNHDLMWLWAFEAYYIEEYYPDRKVSQRFFQDFSGQYNHLVKNVFAHLKLPELSAHKVNEYIYTYYNVTQWGNVCFNDKESNYLNLW